MVERDDAPGGGPSPGRRTYERQGVSHWAGEPIRVLEQRWEIPLLEAHETLGSTNDRLRTLAEAGAPPYTVVVAEEQTAGRGRGGSSWISPAGMGIWMSVLVPGEGGGRPPVTPLLVGVSVVRAVHGRGIPLRAGLKWPNDVEVEGRKVCGILCEGIPSGATVAGIGINVTGDPGRFPSELRERATTLEAATGVRGLSRTDLAGAILRDLRELTDPVPRRIPEDVVRELEGLDVLRGRRIRTSAGVEGRGMGIDPAGALLVEPKGGSGIVKVVAGSVRRVE
ncbi:MAG: biotin--[acetyl-CoA-carboxylase] ligase [Longimicrobiales bacterium]|nr:biotin--[acetyl-CoA-carboxylase] ligase [Longimicrobiales bacterium]